MAGKNFNDRVLASEVRTMALEKVKQVLKKGKGELFEQVLLRLAGNLLPRLNVLSGDEDKPLIVEISESASRKYAINKGTGRDTE